MIFCLDNWVHFTQAFLWFSLSAARSTGNLHDSAAAAMERVAKQLTPRQLEEGMKAAAEWKPKEKECCPQ